MRVVFAWILIVVGLIPFTGGLGMLTTFWTLDQAAEAEKTAKAREYPNHPTAGLPYRNPNAFAEYGSSVASIAIGLLIVLIGVWLKWPAIDALVGRAIHDSTREKPADDPRHPPR